MSDDGEFTEDDLLDEKQPGRQLAVSLDALATHPLAPALGGISCLRIPADPPLQTMRARQKPVDPNRAPRRVMWPTRAHERRDRSLPAAHRAL